MTVSTSVVPRSDLSAHQLSVHQGDGDRQGAPQAYHPRGGDRDPEHGGSIGDIHRIQRRRRGGRVDRERLAN